MTTILIAGGGIGGLAAALAAAGAGHRVTVLERQGAFAELGAGIQIAPNGFQALDRLGVGDVVRARAVHVDELRLMDGTTGARVQRLPLDDRYRARFGNPYAVVHRADLHAALLAACRDSERITLRGGSTVTGYTRWDGGVELRLDGGASLSGDALVGADGIRSAIRARLIGDGEPLVSGHTIYRSVIPMDEVPAELRWNAVTLWAGPGWHFVHYPIGGGRFLNLAATRDNGATVAVTGLEAPRDLVLRAFPELGDTARRLLELGREWREWVLCDRDPVSGWTDGPVALLGDAAHPMLQYAAQGACMALEDAVVLGRALAGARDGGDCAEAFAAYEAERGERTARTTLVAREMGRQLYHPRGAEALARNAYLSGLSTEELHGKVSWLHAGPPDAPGGLAAALPAPAAAAGPASVSVT
ncbi:3-hydroxybenzoate 6-monooxygenase [Streptacidiphilus sp. EB129]|uniref:3-hydroxybenzoate 6-monooxygenase n=1 Tax=Streptacidiphilus sp. EB129 TaxID=3156262 RepID=UPI00351454E6